MTYAQALKIAQQKLADRGASYQEIDRLNTKRQVKKFNKGFGRVRMLAGLAHTRVAK